MRIALFPVLLLLAAGNVALSQPVCDCGLGKLGFFDFDVRPPRPTDPDAIQRYWALFDVARFTAAKVRQDRSCPKLQYIDTHVSAGGALRYGIATANPAPSGPLDFDYVFTGQITETGGTYTVEARIEAGRTREVVKSASYTFKDPGTGPSLPAYAVADNLGAQLSPLSAVITAWEKKKRDGDPGIARSNPEGTMTLRPAKTHLDADETTDVEVQLSDCDGVALKQRKIHFEPGTYETLGRLEGTTNGTVQPSEVLTDIDGRAHVKYTAGQRRGPAEIRGWYGHHRPSGFPNSITGEASITIGQATPLKFKAVSQLTWESGVGGIEISESIETVYEPARSGRNCTTAMQAGESCDLIVSSVRGEGACHGDPACDGRTARIDAVSRDVSFGKITARTTGGTLLQFRLLEVRASGPLEEYVGLCAAQQWQPGFITLTAAELNDFASLKKTIPVHSPPDVNGCTGTGTVVLTGMR